MLSWQLLTLVACAPKQGFTAPAGEPIEDAPRWETKAGQRDTKLELARTLIDEGTPEAGLVVLAKLREEGIDGEEVDLLQARALRKVGMLEDSEALLVKLVEDSPKDPEFRNEYGILWMDRHDVDSAIAQFAIAADGAPEDPDIQNNYGFSLIAANRSEEAVPVLRAALKLDSSRARVRNNLGHALVAMGEDDQAYRLFRTMAPEADAHYKVAMALEMRGDLSAARDRYGLAVAANPSHYNANAALAKLVGQPKANPETPPEE